MYDSFEIQVIAHSWVKSQKLFRNPQGIAHIPQLGLCMRFPNSSVLPGHRDIYSRKTLWLRLQNSQCSNG